MRKYKIKKIVYLLIICGSILQITTQCKDKDPNQVTTNYNTIDNTLGFGIFSKIKGIWNGPVNSTTALGSYPEWIVDFRPIAENQISSKNELDTLNNIQMSLFIVKYNNEHRVCFRNGGTFNGLTRISYFIADSVYESTNSSYFKFVELIKGKSRAYTEFIFKNDSLTMNSYTNKYNALSTPTLHSSWKAKLQDITSSQVATDYFTYPKKTLTKDFSNSFSGVTEAIFYNTIGGDPYDDASQPYLGQASISYNYTGSYTPNASKNVLLVITTQPLISGFSFNTSNLKYRSRYVILNALNQDFNFTLMHPGLYYLYAFYDADGNNTISSGDWVSATNTTFTVPNHATVSATTQINFTIP